ncbi:MAG TPA: hypothetical protein V6C89_05520 [Drouetiella sp.]|jgi:hypothetical protein
MALWKRVSLTNKKISQGTSILIVTMAQILGFVPCSAATTDQTELQRGIQSFSSKHYSDAVSHLQFYVNANPHESIGHYYLANCLFNLGYQKPCLDEYAAALRESTSQKMTDYCRAAIQQMQSSKQSTINQASSVSSAGTSSASQFANSQSANNQSARSRAFAYPPTALARPLSNLPYLSYTPPVLPNGQTMSVLNSAPIVVAPLTVDTALLPSGPHGVSDLALEKALVRMADQTNVEIETLQRDYASDLQSLKEHLSDEIVRINRDGERGIQTAIDNQRSGKGTSSLDSTIDSIKRDTASRIQNAQSSYEAQAQAHQQELLSRINKIVSASRLSQSQIADSRRLPGSPNLQLVGSDLYTRNYAPGPEPPPPDELLATPERLVLDAHSRPGQSIYKIVREPAAKPLEAIGTPGTDLKVHGELIK